MGLDLAARLYRLYRNHHCCGAGAPLLHHCCGVDGTGGAFVVIVPYLKTGRQTVAKMTLSEYNNAGKDHIEVLKTYE